MYRHQKSTSITRPRVSLESMASNEARQPLLPNAAAGPTSGSGYLTDSETDGSQRREYHVYPLRWFILVIVTVLNATNAMIWISFGPIADLTATFYSVTLSDVNWLSIVYMVVFLPIGIFSAWIVDHLGLRFSILVGTWLNAIGASLRAVSALSIIPLSYSFPVLMTGQALAGLAQPIAMIVPVKVAALWFGADQRTLANSIGTMANPLGVMIANFMSPHILANDLDNMLWLMVSYAALPILVCLLATFGVCNSRPRSPPSPSAADPSELFFAGLKKIFKVKMFWVLFLTFGVGMGSATATTTLIQQILCPHGYSDSFSGICGALFIIFGIILAAVTGIIVDKWKIFEEVAKMCWGLAALSFIAFVEVSRIPDMPVLVAGMISLAGMFSFPLFPLTLELAVETTYPIAEATSSSCIIIFGQLYSIVLLLVMQELTTDMPPGDPLMPINCNQFNSTAPNLNYTTSNLAMVGILSLATIVFISFFRTDYKRLLAEQRLAAARILNISREVSIQNIAQLADDTRRKRTSSQNSNSPDLKQHRSRNSSRNSSRGDVRDSKRRHAHRTLTESTEEYPEPNTDTKPTSETADDNAVC